MLGAQLDSRLLVGGNSAAAWITLPPVLGAATKAPPAAMCSKVSRPAVLFMGIRRRRTPSHSPKGGKGEGVGHPITGLVSAGFLLGYLRVSCSAKRGALMS